MIRRVVLENSSGRPVLVVRYEDMKRNPTKEVEERGERGRGSEGGREGRVERNFALNAISIYHVGIV